MTEKSSKLRGHQEGLALSDDHKAAISAGMIGLPGHSQTEATRMKISASKMGRGHSEEAKERMRIARQAGIQARLEAGLPARGAGVLTEEQRAKKRASAARYLSGS